MTTEREKPTKKDKKKGTKKLPWCTLYIAWILCFVTTVACSVVLVLYGMSFGNTKSWEWFATITLSLFKDVLFAQPIKIFVMALITSIIAKKVAEEDETELEKQNRKVAIQNALSSDVVSKQVHQDETASNTFTCKVFPSQAQLHHSKFVGMRKARLRWVVREIIFSCILLILTWQSFEYSRHGINQNQSAKRVFGFDSSKPKGHRTLLSMVIFAICLTIASQFSHTYFLQIFR